MRFISYTNKKQVSWGGLLNDSTVVDLKKLAPTLRAAIAEDKLSGLDLNRVKNRFAIDSLSLLPPIPSPEKIICIGVNYANRNAEYRDGSETPKFPSVFMRTPDSLTAHNKPLIRPPESDQLDYEGEIVVIIGKEGRRIAREDAYQHIAGLSIMNEGTLRDWVRHAKFNVTQGKNFYHSGSIGPWMVSADQFTTKDYENLQHYNPGKRRDPPERYYCQYDVPHRLSDPLPFYIFYAQTW